MFLFRRSGRGKMVKSVSSLVAESCKPLPPIEDKSFGSFDSFANSRIVLIGDASHGTSEFYRARAAITQRLIEYYGFNHHPSSKEKTLSPVFQHFPEWMWRNEEMQGFVNWLRAYNEGELLAKRAGVYGLDLHSMGTSIKAIEDPAIYGRVALHKGDAPCEHGVVKLLQQLLEKRIELSSQPQDGEGFFDAEMNARLIRDSERYYRSMYWAGDESWNLRDVHMFETLRRLLKAKGGRAVVWTHNSHLGDARATGMGQSRDELNLGQLCRENFTAPGEVSIIGMGTHDGEVAPADAWNEPMQVMAVNPSRKDSYERIMHDTGIPSFLLDMKPGSVSDEARKALEEQRLERFIGQFDAYLWFDRTSAVRPLEIEQHHEGISRGETYPFSM
ncbi:erythromycin esterase [Lojkania enalia]|uniref:Erythromycin esterase n=1 Tax=Lojkania enalia TaxID=147567 RepID=A0A9P4K546_9PLEO|nr:erythromycin esterase [Didymosphaeria enalia]